MLIQQRFLQFRNLVFQNYRYIINHAQKSWKLINFNQNEPNIVFDYLKNGVKYLNGTVAPILSAEGFSTKFASVFIYQKPIVTPISYTNSLFGEISNKNCELGDLLTLFIMLDRKKKILHQRAFISQAKKEDKLENQCQRLLYEESQGFKYFRGGCEYNGEIRTLPNIEYRHLGMNYLILDKSCTFIKLIPFNNIIKVPWGKIIFLTLSKAYGLMFKKNEPINGIGWSRIVYDLIKCTGQSAFRGQSRANYLKEFLNKFNDYKNYDEYFLQIEESSGGIPILFIIVQDNEVEL